MARYRITGPDGAAYDITAPDGASEADVMTFAASQMSSLANPTRTPPPQPENRQEAPAQGAARFAAPQMAGAKMAPDWSQIPGMAARNLGGSAANLAGDLVHAITHPVETASGLVDLAAGVVSKGANAVGLHPNPDRRAEIEATADAVGKSIADRYGSVDAIKRTLANDPVGAAADIALPAKGAGGALKGVGLTRRAGEAVSRAADFIDPVSLTGRAIGGAARGASAAVPVALGLSSGAGAQPVRQAYRAGKEGSDVFFENMRGQRPISESVDMARSAVDATKADRTANYLAGKSEFAAVQEPVRLFPAIQAVEDARASIRATNEAGDVVAKVDPVAEAKLRQVAAKIAEFDKLSGPYGLSVAHADDLKKAIGVIWKGINPQTQGNASRVVGNVYNAVKASIEEQAPTYAKTMRDYANASDAISEVERTLSLGQKATNDTAARKLQSTMRNNVNTSFGQRESLLNKLAEKQPELPNAVAGQALNSLAPRGLQAVTTLGAAWSALSNPLVAPFLPLTSPRVVGEIAGGAGRAAGAVEPYVAAIANATRSAGLNLDRSQLMALALAQMERGGVPQDWEGKRQ